MRPFREQRGAAALLSKNRAFYFIHNPKDSEFNKIPHRFCESAARPRFHKINIWF
jgi:hypothetical protein